jgi:hypothetical protein
VNRPTPAVCVAGPVFNHLVAVDDHRRVAIKQVGIPIAIEPSGQTFAGLVGDALAGRVDQDVTLDSHAPYLSIRAPGINAAVNHDASFIATRFCAFIDDGLNVSHESLQDL